MKTQKICLLLALVFPAALIAGCHNAEPVSTAGVPPPPASVKENGIQMQEYQINHSNLPADQKARALEQIHASGGK